MVKHEYSARTAGLALMLGGALWGLYWIPVRYFLDQGLTGPWPGVVMYIAALIGLVPFAWPARRMLVSHWRILLLSGAFTGAAFSLYSTSLVYTDVVRAILLFYLTPIWGTLLGLVFLGERLTAARMLGLLLGVGGLFVVLGSETGFPWPRYLGDWLALASGVAWAVGSLGLYRTRGIAVPIQIFAFLLGALAASALGIMMQVGLGAPLPTPAMVWSAAPLAALSVIYVLPMLFLTIWPATRLTPARVGLLLMSEVIVGILSAAWLSGEHFGWREAIGATLIVGAAVIEILGGEAEEPEGQSAP